MRTTESPNFRKKTSAGRAYLQIVESRREGAQVRQQMIATLDSFRATLEDLGGGLGVTDPIAGPVVFSAR